MCPLSVCCVHPARSELTRLRLLPAPFPLRFFLNRSDDDMGFGLFD